MFGSSTGDSWGSDSWGSDSTHYGQSDSNYHGSYDSNYSQCLSDRSASSGYSTQERSTDGNGSVHWAAGSSHNHEMNTPPVSERSMSSDNSNYRVHRTGSPHMDSNEIHRSPMPVGSPHMDSREMHRSHFERNERLNHAPTYSMSNERIQYDDISGYF